MTALEKIGSPPTRLQRDRALRLGLSGPGGSRSSADLHRSRHFRSRDDPYLRRHLDLSRARKRNSARQRFHHPAHGPASAHHRARCRRKNPRALQSLHPSRHDAVPLGKGQYQIVPMPVPRLEFSQHRQTARRAVAGGLCRRPARSEIQSCPGAARGILPRLHFRHAQSRCAAADASISARSRPLSTNGSIAIRAARSWSARPTGSGTRATGSSPTTIHATAITSPIRIARCWKPRIASPARTPRAWRTIATRPTPSRCTCATPATAITSRTSGRIWKSGRAAFGRWRARIPAWSTTRPSSSSATATAPSRCSISPAPSRSTSTSFRTSRCSATISRCSSRSASRRPTPSGTAP